MYTATPKPTGDQRQKLQPEGGREITEPVQNPKPPVQGRRSIIHTASLIRKVSKMLRDNKNMEKYYEPRAVSIGLLHHDEIGLHSKIKAKIVRFKQCYAEEDVKRVNISDENLAGMFLIDGFVLLHYICYASLGKLNDMKNIGMDMEAFSQDLFLLENQLPYEVLDDIMTSATKGGVNMRNLIDKFIDQTMRDIRGSPLKSPSATSTSTSTSTSPQQQQPPPARSHSSTSPESSCG
ncbi:hypothetical protein LWI28_025723 [Acer negundo]|uniref:Uncharacterized protein n=1 Tax=Acer negundo TaxID=4023 RepID=A0AAD5NJT8_ACENE|nr:hypothetical protein LWI28_025723 [Acer negundo]